MPQIVSLCNAHIVYGATAHTLQAHVASKHLTPVFYNAGAAQRPVVVLTDEQFVRFKSAGRRHPSKTPGKMAGGLSRDRADRRASPNLQKWDTDRYGNLTGRAGPWGGGADTNRDHLLAHSENIQIWKQQQKAHQAPMYGATSVPELKRRALAVTVSGKHHRTASETYGGRVRQNMPGTNIPKQEYAVQHPEHAARFEMESMLEWKADPASRASNKSTLRLEMVGAYFFLYKKLVDEDVMAASQDTDEMLLKYLQLAAHHPDQRWRLNPNVLVAPHPTTGVGGTSPVPAA